MSDRQELIKRVRRDMEPAMHSAIWEYAPKDEINELCAALESAEAEIEGLKRAIYAGFGESHIVGKTVQDAILFLKERRSLDSQERQHLHRVIDERMPIPTEAEMFNLRRAEAAEARVEVLERRLLACKIRLLRRRRKERQEAK